MKKSLLALALCAAAFAPASAQDKPTGTYVEFPPIEMWGMEMPVMGAFNKVSANGQYAVGSDESGLTGMAFFWSRATGELTTFGDPEEVGFYTMTDVSNDGKIVGAFENEAGEIMPGYKESADAEWTALPVPEDHMPAHSSNTGYSEARAISSDGRIIAGHVRMSDYMLHPVLWVDGQLQEFPNVSVKGQGFFVRDVSEDGSIIVGMCEAETGGQNPSFIKDGVMTTLVDCDADEYYTFNGGIVNSIDAEGNMYGYWTSDEGVTTALTYNETDGLVWIENAGMPIATCSDGTHIFGMASAGYGPACALVNDEVKSLSDIYDIDGIDGMLTVTDCTPDGSVVVGGGLKAIEGLGAANTPTLFIVGNDIPAGIQADAAKNNVCIRISGTSLFVTGLYDRVEVFATTGVKVASSSVQGAPVSLAGAPAGTYIVKVTTGKDVKTFKVCR